MINQLILDESDELDENDDELRLESYEEQKPVESRLNC